MSLGEKGCYTRTRDGKRGIAPGVRCDVVDTTGAGDTFTAGFLFAYLRGRAAQPRTRLVPGLTPA